MNQTILRNLFYTLKRFRTASVLNLFGLSFAFAAFIVIMMKVNYERGFDGRLPSTPTPRTRNTSTKRPGRYRPASPRW